MGALGRLLYPGGGGKVTCYHRLQPACVWLYTAAAHCRHSVRSNCSVCLLQLMLLLLMHVMPCSGSFRSTAQRERLDRYWTRVATKPNRLGGEGGRLTIKANTQGLG